MTRVPYAGDEKASLHASLDRHRDAIVWKLEGLTEHVLAGGNVAAGVVRVGDTVRKPAGFWTPAVEALVAFLEARGFTGAPRPLGRDGYELSAGQRSRLTA